MGYGMLNRGDPKIHSRTWSKADTSKQREKGWGWGSMTHLRMKGHFSLNYQEGKKKCVNTTRPRAINEKDFFESDFFPGNCELYPSAAIHLILSLFTCLIVLFQCRLLPY